MKKFNYKLTFSNMSLEKVQQSRLADTFLRCGESGNWRFGLSAFYCTQFQQNETTYKVTWRCHVMCFQDVCLSLEILILISRFVYFRFSVCVLFTRHTKLLIWTDNSGGNTWFYRWYCISTSYSIPCTEKCIIQGSTFCIFNIILLFHISFSNY
jgi:hypothetical protein